MAGEHALLSPSAAHRWLNCPAAPRLEALEEEQTSAAAEEGTLAHAIAASKLKDYMFESTFAEEEEIKALWQSYYAADMEEHTDVYVDMVLEAYARARRDDLTAELMIERRLDFKPYIPEGFGTSDAIVAGAGTLAVFDFKYGAGVEVSAKNNPQMMIYALGALSLCRNNGMDFDTVSMTIVQPRKSNVSTCTMSVAELERWGVEELQPAARLAYSGKGAAVAGEWCRFCRVKARCAALAVYCTQSAAAVPGLLTAEQIAADVLPRLDTVRGWLDAVEDYALKEALRGTDFPGYKVVEGWSCRRITDAEGAVEALRNAGYSDIDIYKPAEIRGITELEGRLGRRRFAELLEPYMTKPKGKPKLAPLDDKRRDFFSAESDFAGIEV